MGTVYRFLEEEKKSAMVATRSTNATHGRPLVPTAENLIDRCPGGVSSPVGSANPNVKKLRRL